MAPAEEVLRRAAEHAARYLQSLDERPPGATATLERLRDELGGPLPSRGESDLAVLDALASAAETGLSASTGGRYYGFVIGGTLPVALAADWLTSTWDQNAGLYVISPAAAVVEEVALTWLRELLGLPEGVSGGFVTGCQMAHVTALAAARHHVLAAAGWNLLEDGLQGSPRLRVLASAERHVTIDRALRYLGIGLRQIEAVPVDEQGRLRPNALADALATGESETPTIVCAQAGDVNTGGFDPLDEIADVVGERAWLHIDGAFGLWAAASPQYRHLAAGAARADSWATDAHKWLNVPYDSGIVFCAHPDAHRAAMSVRAAYLEQVEPGAARDEIDWVPEFSRRARAFPVYAALRALGSDGVADLVARSCAHATRFAELLGSEPGVEILNEVVLNQVLVRFGDDETTRATIAAVQADGTCWLSGTEWQGRAAMRISVSSWRTTDEDVERSAAAITRAFDSVRQR